eukprot:scaffold175_cov414-Prasinococcus_capsulatus_cf.AAC.1
MEQEQVKMLLNKLVLGVLGDEAAPEAIRRTQGYCLRILGSRLTPTVRADENAVCESIKRELANEKGHGAAVEFSELYAQLAKLPSLKNRWALLHLLQTIAQDKKAEAAGGIPLEWSSTISSSAVRGGLPVTEAGDPKNTTLDRHGLILSVLPVDNGAPSEQSMDHVTNALADTGLTAPSARNNYGGQVPEAALVKDLIFVFQGIDGRLLKFDSTSSRYRLTTTKGISTPMQQLIERLSELGVLYRRVQDFAGKGAEHSNPALRVGTVEQSFQAALRNELSDFYRLIAVLESQAHQPLASGTDAGGQYLSLRRLVVWTAEPLHRMKLMVALVDAAQGNSGGALLSALDRHCQHGDPFTSSFVAHIVKQASEPILRMISRWIFHGELEDAYSEFFIAVTESVPDVELWQRRYRLRHEMLPTFIDQDLAELILRTGKGINFLRCCCQKEAWSGTMRDDHEQAAAAQHAFTHGNTDKLSDVVKSAAAHVGKMVTDTLMTTFNLKEHWRALRGYLLLGQGDFIQNLMDSISVELDSPAKEISVFKLSGLLEGAIRGSNAQYDDAEMLNRLAVKMLPFSGDETGWDVFSLEYSVHKYGNGQSDPLPVVFAESTMNKYLRIFNFLWRLRRVEHALTRTWHSLKPASVLGHGGFSKDVQFRSQLRRFHTLHSEMSHFVSTLQYYVMFEVLEASFDAFSEEIEAGEDLDTLVAAHENYLDSILTKALLCEPTELVAQQLSILFETILEFHRFAEKLYEAAWKASQQFENDQVKIEKSAAKGKWAFVGRAGMLQDEMGFSQEFVARTGEGLDSISRRYGSALSTFITLMKADSLESFVDLQSLAFRLDFSEYYDTAGSHMNPRQLLLGAA